MTQVPTLDELAADPAKAKGLPSEMIMALITRCLTLHEHLLLRLIVGRRADGHCGGEEDRLLDVKEAAARLSVTVDWLYRHAGALPFTVRTGRKLRFSSAGIVRFISERQGI